MSLWLEIPAVIGIWLIVIWLYLALFKGPSCDPKKEQDEFDKWKQGVKMDEYKFPKITLTFKMSGFEQYEPSKTDMIMSKDYGYPGSMKILSTDEKKRFIKQAIDILIDKLQEE